MQLEYDRHKDPGRIEYKFGPTLYSCQVSTGNIRDGLAMVRDFHPDVLLGYGGGSDMDSAKLLSRFANCADADVQRFLEDIDTAVEHSFPQLVLNVTCEPKPLILIPTFVGPRAELTDLCIIGGRTEVGSWRRFPVYLDDPHARNTAGLMISKTVLIDSRLSAPRRILSEHLAPSAVSNTCAGIGALLSLHGCENENARFLALKAVALSYEHIMLSRREPHHFSGEGREGLLKGRMSLGLAADSVGHIGVCVRLALGVLDGLVDGRSPFVFRDVLARVSIAVIEHLCAKEFDGLMGETFGEICRAMNVDGKEDVVRQLLRRADDCNMPLFPFLGMAKRTIGDISTHLSSCLQRVECNDVEALFQDSDRIERVLHSSISQQYEL